MENFVLLVNSITKAWNNCCLFFCYYCTYVLPFFYTLPTVVIMTRKKADFDYHKVSRNVKKIGNLYKYHKRTKGCRASEVDGKNYRISNQLEALENIASEQVNAYNFPSH